MKRWQEIATWIVALVPMFVAYDEQRTYAPLSAWLWEFVLLGICSLIMLFVALSLALEFYQERKRCSTNRKDN